MPHYLFEKVAILGLGLMGGSLALELKHRKLAREVLGYNRSAGSRRLALEKKACDQVFANPCEAAVTADLIVFATPVGSFAELAQEIKAEVKPGAIVTDLGSTKTLVVKTLERSLSKTTCVIGGHPIAGTEQTGMKAAKLNLFKDRWWILTPTRKSEEKKLRQLEALLRALGAKPLSMSAEAHDQVLAKVSHLPHLLAFSLMDAMSGDRQALRLAGASFRDASRVAASSAEMWVDICLDNADKILAEVKNFEKSLQSLSQILVNKDPVKLHNFFTKAAKLRKRL